MNLIDILLEVEYPSGFSLGEFDSLMSIKERKAYCEKNLKFLGEGSSRIVFEIDDYTVLKMAKNRKGIAQNMVEAKPEFQNYDIMAKIFKTDKLHTYIIMEKADKVNAQEFEEFTNLKVSEWTIQVEDEDYEPEEQIIRQVIICNPNEYKMEKEDELNEMREAAGLAIKPLYDTKDKELKDFIAKAGL